MSRLHAPRSTLHTVQPLGLDTPDVESLTSYFCRLAHSHGITSQKLADWVLDYFDNPVCEKYGWHKRKLVSMSEESEDWAAWLSELTGVESLDRLTLVPWRHLVGTPGLAPKSERWCPCCLAEDLRDGREPYLRLAWDIAPATACLRHKVQLVSACPHCQKSNIRNRAAIVVPGYCTACGGFLGDAEPSAAAPESLWVARQVGNMIQHPPSLDAAEVVPLLETVIERMAGGHIGKFAAGYGFSKSGIWHWLRKAGLPGLNAWLTIAARGGIGLDKLFSGDIADWVAPDESSQLCISLPASPRAGIRSRSLDWDAIKRELRAMLELPSPVSINEAAEKVGVGRKHLYLRANNEARAIADRHRRHGSAVRQERELKFQSQIGEILDERLAAGAEGMSAREIWNQTATEAKSVAYVFRHIRIVADSR